MHKRLSVKPKGNTREVRAWIGHVAKLQRKNAKQWCGSQDQQHYQEGKNKIAISNKFCFIDDNLCK
jgi:fido (protein-threonine AMPylation protein)